MADASIPATETKAEFAQRIGVSRPRVTQLVAAGLPLANDGKVMVAAALAWFNGRTDPRKRMAKGKPPLAGDGNAVARQLLESKARREQAKAEREELALARERKQSLDADDVRRRVFEIGKAERDSWLAWTMKVSARVAGELGVEPGRLTRVLDHEVREHLNRQADITLESKVVGNGDD